MTSPFRPAMAASQSGTCLYVTPGRWAAPPVDRVAAVLLLACAGWSLGTQDAFATDARMPADLSVKVVAQAAQEAIRRPVSSVQGHQARLEEGLRWMADGRVVEATEQFRTLVREQPGWADAQNNLAVALAARGDYEGARQWLESAVRSDPDFAAAHQNLGDTYARLALLAYERALKLDRESPALAARLVALQTVATPSVQAPGRATPGSSKPAETVRKAVTATPQARTTLTPDQPAPQSQDPRSESADQTEVTRAVQAWVKAWSQRDTGSYLKAYEPDYSPRGVEREVWQAQRKSSISARTRIDLRLENLRVSLDGDEALARFRQHYRSDQQALVEEKVLQLRRNPAGQWLIAKELARPALTQVTQVSHVSQVSQAAAPAVPAVVTVTTNLDTVTVPADAVKQAVERWAKAWRSRDMAVYVSTYADDYAPPGMSRAGWLAQREARIAARKHIELKLSQVRMALDGDRAVVAFVQSYRSGRIQSTEDKALWLQRGADGRWLIVKEAVGRVSLEALHSPM